MQPGTDFTVLVRVEGLAADRLVCASPAALARSRLHAGNCDEIPLGDGDVVAKAVLLPIEVALTATRAAAQVVVDLSVAPARLQVRFWAAEWWFFYFFCFDSGLFKIFLISLLLPWAIRLPGLAA